jgi:hypothetical protein
MAAAVRSRELGRIVPCRSRLPRRQSEGQRTWGGLEVGASRLSEETGDRIQECWVRIASAVEQGRGQIERGHAEPWTS